MALTPMLRRYLADPSHRETFESAHSVVLAIFASYAQQQEHPQRPLNLSSSTDLRQRRIISRLVTEPGTHQHDQVPDRGLNSPDLTGFIPRMIPFYAQCLIEVSWQPYDRMQVRSPFLTISPNIPLANLFFFIGQNSEDGHLRSPQIKLAYSTLVRSASASATTCSSPTHESFELAWYCVESIVDKIRQLTPEEAEMGNVKERLHRLHLALISTVPSLPLPLMIRVLDEIRNTIMNVGDPRERKELVDALFVEMLEIGDREKEASMRWWYTNRPSLAQADDTRVGVAGQDQSSTRISSHL
jgi:hypothetical protein